MKFRRQLILRIAIICASYGVLFAASRPHVIAFGRWMTVKWMVGSEQKNAMDLKIRGLYIDGQVREFTVGAAHDITEKVFAVQNVTRMNDALPQDDGAAAHWQWERSGWLLVNRETGHIAALNLPDFDSYYSVGSWYRDYFAYCGISSGENKRYAIVIETGRRKPVVRQVFGQAPKDGMPSSGCAAPVWERQPARVTFSASDEKKSETFVIRDHVGAVSTEEDAKE